MTATGPEISVASFIIPNQHIHFMRTANMNGSQFLSHVPTERLVRETIVKSPLELNKRNSDYRYANEDILPRRSGLLDVAPRSRSGSFPSWESSLKKGHSGKTLSQSNRFWQSDRSFVQRSADDGCVEIRMLFLDFKQIFNVFQRCHSA